MKKFLASLLFVCLMSSAAFCDVAIDAVNFPDNTFREYVSENFDGDNDGILSDEEIANVTWIDVKESGISSLKGIEYFTSLEGLEARENNLISLDLSKCTNLEFLQARDNQISELNIDGLMKLANVKLQNNKLSRLDISNRPALVELLVRDNNLTELNITGCNALGIFSCGTEKSSGPEHTNHLRAIDLSGKRNLKDLTVKRNNFTALDLTDCVALVSVDCSTNQIANLDFSHSPNLRYIECWNNKLTKIDVSKNSQLEWLDVGSNDIRTIDVSHNLALKHFECYSCNLSELDVSKNAELEYFDCGNIYYYAGLDNNLKMLNLSQNTKLYTLICDNIRLSSLDLDNNSSLSTLRCHNNDLLTLDLSHNPLIANLSCDTREIPSLTVTASSNASYPYQVNLRDYTGTNYGRVASVTGYNAQGEIISSSFTQGNDTALFASSPSRLVYAYNLGYTGSGDIAKVMNVTLTPSNSNGGGGGHGGCNSGLSFMAFGIILAKLLRKH